VVESIIVNQVWRNKVVVICNDAAPQFCQSLTKSLSELPGIDTLRYKPKVSNKIVGDDIATYLERIRLVPTLSFIDPWGYKGLSSRLIQALIKDWGSNCIFFFNYNRINAGINNPKVVRHLNSIFGVERANALRERVNKMTPFEREQEILNELAEALSENRKNYVLPFRFIRPDGKRTSHYLILVSKHIMGYTVMKKIMYNLSSEHNDGVASFSYISVAPNRQLSLLSLFDKPLDGLADELCKRFRGQTLTVQEVFEKHHINTPFVFCNYQEAIRRLEDEKRVVCDPSKRQIRNGVITMSGNVKVCFLR
jgi:three-Cys-motif partner protein